MVKMKPKLPAGTLEGEIELICGARGVTVRSAPAPPPPGGGFVTTIRIRPPPGLASPPAVRRTFNSVLLMYSVTIVGAGYMTADESGKKPVPATVTHVSPLPADTVDGKSEVMFGAGLEGGFVGATFHNSDMPL